MEYQHIVQADYVDRGVSYFGCFRTDEEAQEFSGRFNDCDNKVESSKMGDHEYGEWVVEHDIKGKTKAWLNNGV